MIGQCKYGHVCRHDGGILDDVIVSRYDGYWGFDNNAWDVAGGVVIVREAGGLVTAIDGGRYDPHGRPCLASNGPLHPALLQALRQQP